MQALCYFCLCIIFSLFLPSLPLTFLCSPIFLYFPSTFSLTPCYWHCSHASVRALRVFFLAGCSLTFYVALQEINQINYILKIPSISEDRFSHDNFDLFPELFSSSFIKMWGLQINSFKPLEKSRFKHASSQVHPWGRAIYLLRILMSLHIITELIY